jgi:streptogramin lyase
MDRIEPTITQLYGSGFGVLGQPNFTTNGSNLTQNGFNGSYSVFIDSFGNAWVADYDNSRVLMFAPPFSNGMNASLVLGQSSFTTSGSNTTQNGLSNPISVFIDSSGNAWVADADSNRVLMYVPPFSNGMNASLVLGQPNFTTYNSVVTQNGLYGSPYSVFIDSSGNAWVADQSASRVLMYVPPFSNGMNASLVLGQPNFTTAAAATTQNGLDGPTSVFVDSSGNAWVADLANSRVLMYVPPFSNGMNASLVLGQSSFTTGGGATTQNGFLNPFCVFIDSSGNAWVADKGNSRVLMFAPPFSNGMNASLVLGQSSFTTGTIATTQNGLYYPTSVFVDSSGNAWVVDVDNNRVLMYVPPFSNGMDAGSSTNSLYSSVVYPRKNIFYNPKAGVVKI